MKWAGNKLISVVGARSKDLLVLEDAVRDVSDQTYIMTDDGTAGEQGLVTKKLQDWSTKTPWTTCSRAARSR